MAVPIAPENTAVTEAAEQTAAALRAQSGPDKPASKATIDRMLKAAAKAGYQPNEIDANAYDMYGKAVLDLTSVEALEMTHQFNLAAQPSSKTADVEDPFAVHQHTLPQG